MPYFKWKKAVLKPRSPPPPVWHQLPCNHGLAAMAALPLRKKSGPGGAWRWCGEGKSESRSGAGLPGSVRPLPRPRWCWQSRPMMSWQLPTGWRTASAAQHGALWSPCQKDWQLNGTKERPAALPLGTLPSLMDRKQRERLSLNLKRILFFFFFFPP